MWVGLVFVACLNVPLGEGAVTAIGVSQPQCREHEVVFDGSMMQCMLFGQHRISHWQERNEPWKLKGGYRCKLGKPA